MNIDLINEFRNSLSKIFSKVIPGKPGVIDLVVMSAVCKAHFNFCYPKTDLNMP